MNFLYRWLPRIFGCHCREERSFHVRGIRFPLCTRCTGELAGILAAAASGWALRPGIPVLLLCLLPLLLDGFAQLLTKYESTNPRRFVTGLLFGYSGAILFGLSLAAVSGLGGRIALRLAAA